MHYFSQEIHTIGLILHFLMSSCQRKQKLCLYCIQYMYVSEENKHDFFTQYNLVLTINEKQTDITNND